MNAQRIKENFALVADHGLEVADYFYADLFERNPGYRSLFPASMEQQHKVLLAALAQIVEWVDNTEELIPYLQRLGSDHYGFGVTAEHYPEVGASLVATLRHFSGDSWSPDLEKDWITAYGVVSEVMVQAGGER
jgi:hemoglobin-like flavoprotein